MDYLTFSHFAPRPAPNHEDDIIAALEHPDRVRSIKLAVTSHLLRMMALVMQEPFPALTTLWLSSNDQIAPVLPDIFSIGPAPHLLQIFLEGISFPSLPTLLLSANNLVDLRLKYIPQSGYISPEAMVPSLAVLKRLKSLCIWFKAPISYLRLRQSPLLTRHVLPSLSTFKFRGDSEYLEHLLAQIHTPRLRVIDITYFNQLDFHVPQLSQFIDRTESLGFAQSRHSHGRIRISSLYVELDFEEGHHGTRLTLRISCKWLDWQVSHLAHILGQSPALVTDVEHLLIYESDLQIEPGWKDSVDDTDWLELLRTITTVKTLHISKQLAGHIALALDGVDGESVTEVLPALTSLSLEDHSVISVQKFLAAREISGHPVVFVGFIHSFSSFSNPSLSQAYPSNTHSYSMVSALITSRSSLLTLILGSDGCPLVSYTLPVWTRAFHFGPASSTWSFIRWRRPSPASSLGMRSAPQRYISAFATWRCAVNGRRVAWGCTRAAQLTGAQGAEPHQPSSAAGGEQYSCNQANCVTKLHTETVARSLSAKHVPLAPFRPLGDFWPSRSIFPLFRHVHLMSPLSSPLISSLSSPLIFRCSFHRYHTALDAHYSNFWLSSLATHQLTHLMHRIQASYPNPSFFSNNHCSFFALLRHRLYHYPRPTHVMPMSLVWKECLMPRSLSWSQVRPSFLYFPCVF